MKISRIFTLIATLTLPCFTAGSYGQAQMKEADTAKVQQKYLQRRFLQDIYNIAYSHTPSMLGLWEYPGYSNISASQTFAKGSFRDMQSYGQNSETKAETSSVLRLSQEWTLYGHFSYTNGSSKDVRNNLSYRKGNYLSPYYYIMKAPGDWSYQQYKFQGTAARSLVKGKLYAGASVLYNSHLDFRTVDYRNEQYNLHMELNPSITYIAGKNSFSMGAVATRGKTEPEIYSRYQQSNSSDDYQLYINTGLGSYIKNAPHSTTTNEIGYGPSLSYKREGANSNLIVNYRLLFQSQDFLNKLTSSISEFGKEIGKYTASAHEVQALFTSMEDGLNGYLVNGNVAIINGTGSQYNNVSGSHIKNYTVSMQSAHLNIQRFKEDVMVPKLFATAGFERKKEFDMNYGQSLLYSNLNIQLGMLGTIRKGKSGEFAVELSGKIGKNIGFEHDPKSAAELFVTTQIANPLLSFATSDWWGISAKLVWSKFILDKYCTDIELYGSYRNPFGINYLPNQGYYSAKDNFLNAGINLVFNF